MSVFVVAGAIVIFSLEMAELIFNTELLIFIYNQNCKELILVYNQFCNLIVIEFGSVTDVRAF